MSHLKLDLARNGVAHVATHCVVIGEGASVRIAFLSGSDTDEPIAFLSAVTLSREQLAGFAGMVSAVLDSEDPAAISVS